MNFLAHAYLSGDNNKLLVGNFMGDFVKGKRYESFEPAIAQGIVLHRAIDDFTDNHTIVADSKSRLREKYRHYAGVVVDMIYDHFLAKNWRDYHQQELPLFTHHVYSTVGSFSEILPKRLIMMLGYMKRDNWLLSYAQIEGISQALAGMSRRTKFESHMEEAVIDIKKDYNLFENEFKAFFPEIKSYVEDWLKKNEL